MIRSRQAVFGVRSSLQRNAGNARFPGAWQPGNLGVPLWLGGVARATSRRPVPITHWITPRWAGAIKKEVKTIGP
jgi:hypothetical protein